MSNGKGSDRRPCQVPDSQVDLNWRRTFGNGGPIPGYVMVSVFADAEKKYGAATEADRKRWVENNRRYIVKIG